MFFRHSVFRNSLIAFFIFVLTCAGAYAEKQGKAVAPLKTRAIKEIYETGKPAPELKIPGVMKNWPTQKDKFDGNAFSGGDWNNYYFVENKYKAPLHAIFKKADGKETSVAGIKFKYKPFNDYLKKNIKNVVIIEFYTDGFVGIFYKKGDIVYLIPLPKGVSEQVRDL